MSQLDLLRFPLHGSRLIEASAGTGKTFSLAFLYLRLVLGHGAEAERFMRPLTPKDILVLTFTEAATEELRSRIRERLVEAADAFSQPSAALPGQNDGEDPLLALQRSYPPADWPGCALRLRRAADAMDEAMISTIHGWCNNMLTEHAFDTRGLFNRELVTDQTALLDEIIKDYWRQHFYTLDPEAAEAISDCFRSPQRLHQALNKLLHQIDPQVFFQGQPFVVESLTDLLSAYLPAKQQQQQQQAAYEQYQQQVAALTEQTQRAWQQEWPSIEPFLWSVQELLLAGKHDSASADKFATMLDSLQAWSLGRAKLSAKMKNFAKGRFAFKQKVTIPAIPDLNAFQRMAELADFIDSEKPAAVSEIEVPLKQGILCHALAFARKELDRRLARRAQMGFNDLLTELDRALDQQQSGEHARQLASSIKTAYPVAMIDEFQDTDPLQYRIFNRIYQIAGNPADSAVILIGDPKQAIYSFRGADIYTYLQAKADTSGRHYSLNRNFRSTEGVVQACNQLFLRGEQHERGAFRFKQPEQNPLPYLEVAAQGRKQQLMQQQRQVPALSIVHLPSDEPYSLNDYKALAASWCASQIASLLNDALEHACYFADEHEHTAVQPKDIAVLVRSRAEAQLIKDELAKARIPSVFLSDRDSVFSSSEASDMVHWLRACADPTDLGLVKNALATTTLAIPLTQLALWQDNEMALEQQVQRFMQLHQCWRQNGVLAMVRQLLDYYQWPARVLSQLQGERSLTNVLHLAEWLQQQAEQLDGEQALIRSLTEHIIDPGEEQIMRLESDAALVKIVTIHKSKGLEYPLVFLPFIVGWRQVTGKDRQVSYRIGDQLGLEISDKKLFAEAWQQADDERLSEDMRLLYVAMTRARHALWLVTAATKVGQAKAPQNQLGALGYLLNGDESYPDAAAVAEQMLSLQQDAIVQVMECTDWPEQPYQGRQHDDVLQPALTPADLAIQPWWIASYSAIQFGGSSESKRAEGLPMEPEQADDEVANEMRDEQGQPGQPIAAVELTAHTVLHALPRGAENGTFMHNLLEWAAEQRYQDEQGQIFQGFAATALHHELRLQEVTKRCQQQQIEHLAPALSNWLHDFLTTRWRLTALALPDGGTAEFALAELVPEQLAVELEFILESHAVDTRQLDRLVTAQSWQGQARPQAQPNQLNGMLKGFIDLVAEHQGQYYVIDWKTNWLGEGDDAYSQQAMLDAMLHKRYDMQYVLYLLALHRLLQCRLADYDYDRHVGGAIYAFLRGSHHPETQGLLMDKPPKSLILALDALFRGEYKECANG
ncbi:exodeoxyribonuclease V subunit beta [Alkalimonas collagenimarina]|uniref:RecBCD enzyme subunit RecB n=1 Tax=Alkalimonas collagenimarina TaxID=400390 RepID=A0ABT9GXS6_9GAMM|nr:exodeoxyribonuclease V subunit beta [Alkalimonas collagenimarina]MDP4535864.1 exodeoxyribonuclease V subunit beta [Alkalimonas collagenimarina]